MNDIKSMIEILYNFIYTDKLKTEYLFIPLEIDKIKINDILKDDTFDYDNIIFNNSGDKKNFKILHKFENKTILKKYFNPWPLTLIIQSSHKNILLIDINYELLINQIISEFVILDKIPFYLLNICNFTVEYKKLKLNEEFKELIKNNYDDIKNDELFYISVYEHYNSYISLELFLKNNLSKDDLINILFQIIFALSYLIYKLNFFRHNNFTVDSFIVEKLKAPIELKLNIDNTIFIIKTSFIIKLFNYKKSQMDIVKNNYNCVLNNSTFDIYTILKSLYFYNIDYKNIINDIIPLNIIEKNYDNEQLFLSEYIDIIIPMELLIKNNFINTFIYMPKKLNAGKKSRKSNNEKKSRKLSKKIKKIMGGSEFVNDSSVRIPSFIKKLQKKGGKKNKQKYSASSSKSSSSKSSSSKSSSSNSLSSMESDGSSNQLNTFAQKEIKMLTNQIKDIKLKYKGGKKNPTPSSYGDIMNGAFGQNPNQQQMNPQMMNPQMMNPQMMNPQIMNPQMMNPQTTGVIGQNFNQQQMTDLFTPQMYNSLEQGNSSIQSHPLMQQLSNSLQNNPYMLGGDEDNEEKLQTIPDITKNFFF